MDGWMRVTLIIRPLFNFFFSLGPSLVFNFPSHHNLIFTVLHTSQAGILVLYSRNSARTRIICAVCTRRTSCLAPKWDDETMLPS